MSKPFAIVTGAASGVGLELAVICAEAGFDLLVASDQPEIHAAADRLRALGAQTFVVQTDLAYTQGVDKLLAVAAGRPVDALLVNAGHGLRRGFLEQEFGDLRHVIDANITVMVYLVQRVARQMRARRAGRILLTGSIAGFLPSTCQAVDHCTSAFMNSFALALRAELNDTGVSVTCLMPGEVQAELLEEVDTLDVMTRGEGELVSRWAHVLQSDTPVATAAPGEPQTQMTGPRSTE